MKIWNDQLVLSSILFVAIFAVEHQGQHENIDDEDSVLYNWGPWEDVSQCSRTCGGGVAYQTRQCLNPADEGCLGSGKKYLSCNIMDCPDGSIDFRLEQCRQYNNITFEGKYYVWLPYYGAPNKCELNCLAKGGNFYYRHKTKVIDGTRCDLDTLDVCVDGACRAVGCDSILGSIAREDECRECGGDGSTCKTISGEFNLKRNLTKGYNDMLYLPAGTTNIFIEEIEPSSSYIAVRNTSGYYFLNGNWRIDFPKSFSIAGTTFHYSGSNNYNLLPGESLKARGPTMENLYIVLLYQGRNPGFKYKFSVPNYVDIVSSKTYEWGYSPWSICSRKCSTGYQTRHISCINRNTFEQVADYLCNPLKKEVNNKTCNSGTCPSNWFTGNWDDCSRSCDGGIQSRVVYCQQFSADDKPSIAEDVVCKAAKPAYTRQCNTNVTCPQWNVGVWSMCDKACGKGEQTRQVICRAQHPIANARSDILPESRCNITTKPLENKKCNLKPCSGVEWVVSDWSQCKGTCGSGMQSRQVICADSSGQAYQDSQCHKTKPAANRPCNITVPCTATWHVSEWTKCTVSCGNGVQTRTVMCATWDLQENTAKIASESACDVHKKPATQQICSQDMCTSLWFTGPWSRCSALCDGGTRTRQIMCLARSNGDIVTTNTCNKSDKPADNDLCNVMPCDDETNLIPVGGCLNSPHGCCPDSFTPATGSDYEGCPQKEKQLEGSCKLTEYGCCTDGKTAAIGPFNQGCPTYTCKNTKHGCCKDGHTPAGGPSGEGCPITVDCKSTAYGCCGDGFTAAEGLNLKGCPLIGDSGEIESSGDGEPILPYHPPVEPGDAPTTRLASEAQVTTTPVIPTPIQTSSAQPTSASPTPSPQTTTFPKPFQPILPTEFIQPFQPAVTTTSTVTTKGYICKLTPYGCCADGKTVALGPNNKGCERRVGGCIGTRYGCCPDGKTSAKGYNNIGCKAPSSVCANSRYGCCPDGVTNAEGPFKFGCIPSPSGCAATIYGCCPDGATNAKGPGQLGCAKLVGGCDGTLYGCCPDGITSASGPDNRGCLTLIGGCRGTRFGCCLDGITTATGWGYKGCLKLIPIDQECSNSAYGCCEDDVTKAKGPNKEGCPVWRCANSLFGCCPDGVSTALGHDYKGCSKLVVGTEAPKTSPHDALCVTTRFGCCSDGKSVSGPNGAGCPVVEKPIIPIKVVLPGSLCNSTPYGCCTDDKTVSGPNGAGCPVVEKPFVPVTVELPGSRCQSTPYGCCDDGETVSGPNGAGCPSSVTTPMSTITTVKATTQCKKLYWACRHSGECIPEVWVCDGEPDCKDVTDELHCTTESSNETTSTIATTTATTIAIIQTEPPTQCKKDFVKCSVSQKCIPTVWLCDGEMDCPNGADEINCTKKDVCNTETEFQCNSGQCIRKTWICDGDNDCGDNSDEDSKNCATQVTENCDTTMSFQCKSDNLCIDQHKRCDGIKDCLDKSDETDCYDFCKDGTDQGPCRKYAIKWFYSYKYGGCTRFWYGGCEGNQNRFESKEECTSRCIKPAGRDVCLLPPVKGSCSNRIPRWFYNPRTYKCETFTYSGCLGNENRFETREACEGKCAPIIQMDACKQQVATGSCEDNFERWHFDTSTGICRTFNYSGCQGNDNRFFSEKSCLDKCVPTEDVCEQPKEIGPCKAFISKWYFDKNEKVCKKFSFGGCKGNGNRFSTERECVDHCKATKRDTCLLQKRVGPCTAKLERWWYNSISQKCQSFTYGGCHGNGNRFMTKDACLTRCHKIPSEIDPTEAALSRCTKVADPGPCTDKVQSWYFNSTLNRCIDFTYGGCLGNSNRFSSKQKCTITCEDVDLKTRLEGVCLLPMESGPCEAYIQLFYFDKNAGFCKPFYYGGCGGNRNKFHTQEQCISGCGGPFFKATPAAPGSNAQIQVSPQVTTPSGFGGTDQAACFKSKDYGSGNEYFPVWYYNKAHGTCRRFAYSGSGGNKNRFRTKLECQKLCLDATPPPTTTTIATTTTTVVTTTAPHITTTATSPSTISTIPVSLTTTAPAQVYLTTSRETTTTFSSEPTSKKSIQERYDLCNEEAAPGPCRNRNNVWFYNAKEAICQQFNYGGCEGNANRFKTEQECHETCRDRKQKERCVLPKKTGRCRASFLRYYFDASNNECRPFIYGGCDANGNNFETTSECLRICGNERTVDTVRKEGDCYLELNPGRCGEAMPRWYFEPTKRICKPFYYSGCDGNNNNFLAQDDCRSFCSKDKPLVLCKDTKYGCCPDSSHDGKGNTPAKGPNYQGCPEFSPFLVTSDPKTIAAKYGGNVTFICPVQGLPTPYIDWFTTDRQYYTPLELGEAGKGKVNPSELSLTLSGVIAKDKAVYACRGSNTLGRSKMYHFTLNIEEPEKPVCTRSVFGCCLDGKTAATGYNLKGCPEEAPVIVTKGYDEISVRIGEKAVLPCKTVGSPIPMLTWYKNRRPIPRDATKRVSKASDGSLEIMLTAEDDQAAYICRAYNGVGRSALKNYKLNVLAPPNIERGPSVITTARGETIKLHCTARGTPAPTVTWRHNNQLIPSNSDRFMLYPNNTLVVRQIDFPDEGDWTCSARSHLGSDQRIVALSIEEPISLVMMKHNKTYRTGNILRLICRGQGYPRPSLRWSKDGTPIESNSVLTRSGELILRDIKLTDSGRYTCTGSNNVETKTISTRIKVIPHIPVVPPGCTDNPIYAKCSLIVKGRLCNANPYFKRFCCKSCVLAGQLPT